MKDLTVAELGQMIERMHDDLRAQHVITQIILADLGAGTHLTKEQAAAALSRLRKKPHSVRTVERMIASGQLTNEQMPGTQSYGIPIEEIHAGWLPVGKLRAAQAKDKKSVSERES